MGPARWGLLREHAHRGISPGMAYTWLCGRPGGELPVDAANQRESAGSGAQPGSCVSFASCSATPGDHLPREFTVTHSPS